MVEASSRRPAASDGEPGPVDGRVGQDVGADVDGHRPLVAREDADAESAVTDHDVEARVPERDRGWARSR